MTATVLPSRWSTTSTASSKLFMNINLKSARGKSTAVVPLTTTLSKLAALLEAHFIPDVEVASSRFRQATLSTNYVLQEQYVALRTNLQRMSELWLNGAENYDESQVELAQSFDAADMALDALCFWGIPAPHPMISSEGTLGVFWRFGARYVSIDFDADGEFPYGVADGLKVSTAIWNSKEDLQPPAALMDALPRA